MSKVFRLYKEGSTTYRDWNSSPTYPYNSNSRDTIDDPDGKSARNEITSIPSPFARIDLVKTAFKEVCKTDKKTKGVDLDGKTIFHKMVSDTLDVAEIFFNIDKFSDKIEIIKWDPDQMLGELERSSIDGHRFFADALRKYMLSDAKTYNFDRLKNIYLLNYKNGPDELNIIGATSPATLFFCNANNLSYVNDIFFGEDKPFDEDFQPLYKRDFAFVSYLFTLRKSINCFADLFPEIDDYLNRTYTQLSQEKKARISDLNVVELDCLDVIQVSNVMQSDNVEVLGYPLYKKNIRPQNIRSDFQIKTELNDAVLPLVLPVEAGNRYGELWYTTGKWGKTNKAPFYDKNAFSDRKLPFDGSKRAYLTIGDFLEDTIIRVPYTLNSINYFDGHITNPENELSYLLPIKPLLFKYFDVQDLCGNMPDGKPMFEMTRLAGDSVSVTLRIPIVGRGSNTYIEYTRLYYNDCPADLENNAGSVTELRFTGLVMPLVKFIEEKDAIYNTACIQSANDDIEFAFYQGADLVAFSEKTCREKSRDELSKRADCYLLKHKNFDYIRVSGRHNEAGIILPKFIKQRSIADFEFAIDLGTSNTHIEFRKKGEQRSMPFTYSDEDRQAYEIFSPTINENGSLENLQAERTIIEADFLPNEVGAGDFHFPTRTVLSCAKGLDWDKTVDPYMLVNVPLTYNKRRDLRYNDMRCDIKWGTGDDLKAMDAYIRGVLLLIRNKVLINGGNLRRTCIIWFYPISMAPKRRRLLKDVWNKWYKEYFGGEQTNCMTESSAPIQYYFSRYSTTTSLVNVDIGGGTTDIAFAKDGAINYVTSFRFATNALFEDSFSRLDDTNGIIDRYKDDFKTLLERQNELMSVFDSESNRRPSNMASFLFSLKDNSMVKKAKINEKSIDFNNILLQDEDFKISFIIFYTAIVYHIAQITKVLGLEMPRHISFSGNGSKIVRVITTDLDILSKYTKIVFEKVLGRPYDKSLEIIGLEDGQDPKESTCKGGLIGRPDDNSDMDRMIVLKSSGDGLVSNMDTYSSIEENTKQKTIESVKKFFKLIFCDLNDAFCLDDNFGVTASSFKAAKEASDRDLETYLDKGISQREKESERDAKIEESLFFYPIKGALQSISNSILTSLRN